MRPEISALFLRNRREGRVMQKVFSKFAAIGAALLLLILIALLAVPFMRSSDRLSTLPPPDDSSPFAMVSARGGEFPLRPVRLCMESSILFPRGGESPLAILLPLFEAARSSALVVTERENGFAAYGTLSLSQKERSALLSGSLPPSWSDLFVSPEVYREDGLLRVGAANTSSPIYIEPYRGYAFVADSLSDIDRMRAVRSGAGGGIKARWTLKRSWGGHLRLSDGGALGELVRGEPSGAPVTLELAWNSDREDSLSGKFDWRVFGLERHFTKGFVRNVKQKNWSLAENFIPEPLLLAFGVNLPDPGRNLASLPAFMKPLGERLRKMGLKEKEARNILTGPVIFSIGGKTQVLWFELPGLTLNLPDRGKDGNKLLDVFWSEFFMGATPRPVRGYTHGGTTDLPFSLVAAGNDRNTVIALAAPDVERNGELSGFLKEEKAVGWFFLDLPKTGSSLAEMPSLDALFSENDDAGSTDTTSIDRLGDSLKKLGRVFFVWKSGASGHGSWFE